MNPVMIPANWREVFAPEKSQNLGNGMFSPALRYETDRIYLFGVPSGFSKTFIACGEAVRFASRGCKTLYIHTEMSDEAVMFDRFSHCVDFDKAIGNLSIGNVNTLEEIDTSIFDSYQVIILDGTYDDGLDEESEPDEQPDLTRFIKTLSNYRMKHPDKMFLVYAPLEDRCNTRKEFVDACFIIKRDGIKCTKDRCLDWRGEQK